jgi:peptidoglycan/xylan/chitin deacetylase (PgdA/CDA1 family)
MLPSVLYLTWHGLGEAKPGMSADERRYWLSVDAFASTLDAVSGVECRSGTQIRFTFDDGNQTDHSVALPLLLAAKKTATFFICAGRIGRAGFLDSSQIKELAASGMRIGCHGFEHLSWRDASDATLYHELNDGRRALEDVIGQSVDVASTPFGALDRRSVAAAKKAGYTTLFASSGGFATADTGLVPRNTIKTGFDAHRDLPAMVSWTRSMQAAIYDTARRMKYGFF